MNITLNETPEQIELFKAIGSKDRIKSMQAQEALAAFITPAVQTVLDKAGFASMIFRQFNFNEDEPATIPLDLYLGQAVNAVTVWYQNMPGGLPTTHVQGNQELTVATYNLTSAVSMLKKYARRSRLDVVAAALNRMANELLVKSEYNKFAVLLRAIGEASTTTFTGATSHIITSTTTNVLQIDDFNRLMTLARRLNVALDFGTPTSRVSNGITDLFLSPEMMEQIRGFSYQPVNTRNGATTSSGATSIALPDNIREEIYRNSGIQSIFGKNLFEMLELGNGYAYNVLFGQFASGNIAHGSTFNTSTDEIIIGLDLTAPNNAFISPVGKDADGQTVTNGVDEQWFNRSETIGWYSSRTEGAVVCDARRSVALTV